MQPKIPFLKYAGNQVEYPMAIILETKIMPKSSAIALPPFILTSTEMGKNRELMRHEYGHFLQYAVFCLLSLDFLMGYLLYLVVVGLPSVLSAYQASRNMYHFHQGTWVEKSANQLSYWFKRKPSNWNFSCYPLYKS